MNEPSKEWFSGAIWLVQQRPEIEAVEWYSEVAVLRLRLRSEFWYPIVAGRAMRGESQSVRERDASLINCVDPLGHEAAGDLRFTRADLLARVAHDTIPAPPIQEVASGLSRSEARWLEMVRVAGIDLRREVRKVT